MHSFMLSSTRSKPFYEWGIEREYQPSKRIPLKSGKCVKYYENNGLIIVIGDKEERFIGFNNVLEFYIWLNNKEDIVKYYNFSEVSEWFYDVPLIP